MRGNPNREPQFIELFLRDHSKLKENCVFARWKKKVQYSVACCKHFCMSAAITVCNQCKSMTSNLTHAA